jgi:hypothetical protein
MSGGEPPATPVEVKKYLQQSHDRIFENNKKWATEQKAKHPEFFEKLAQGQSPDYLWIGKFFSPPKFSFCIINPKTFAAAAFKLQIRSLR